MSSVLLLALLLTAPEAAAKAPPARAAATLAPVTVQGAPPGPPIWRVSRGGHALWILGTVSPLPKDTQWQPRDVEAVLAHADEVLMPAGAYIRLGFGSLFMAASLAPSARRMQYNPGRATLSQVLPPATHVQWLALKSKYIGKDDKAESLRPMFAADSLYSKAVTSRGMKMGTAWPQVAEMAKRNRIKVTDARLNLLPEIERKSVKAGIKQNSGLLPGEVACFTRTLDGLESNLVRLRARADAWSVGDVERLRADIGTDVEPACSEIEESMLLGIGGFADLHGRIDRAWLQSAERALASNANTFAVLPVTDLLKAGGALASFSAQGYAVEAPDDVEFPWQP